MLEKQVVLLQFSVLYAFKFDAQIFLVHFFLLSYVLDRIIAA